MKTYELGRSEVKRLQRSSKDIGKFAEEIAAAVYADPQRDFRDERTHDLRGEHGAVYEVKSALDEMGQKYPAKGRFRLWEEQHESMVRKDRDGTAWYIFVLFEFEDDRPRRARLTRVKPAKIGRSIGARGGWNESGHPAGKQYKVTREMVFK
jgi:hypothetical protein